MTTESSIEKWPTQFKVVPVSESVLGEELNLYFVTGVVNSNQYKFVDEATHVRAVHEIDTDKLVVSTLINRKQIEELNETFEPRSRSWRGQYYALANAIVDACRSAL